MYCSDPGYRKSIYEIKVPCRGTVHSERMSAKKLINSRENCVEEALYGFCCSHPGLAVCPEDRRILFHTIRNERRRIAVLSGGGSGHEPFPSGYVGEGMLAASVSGAIFTSPSSRQILRAIRMLSVDHEGVFLIVPNYTGDRLNFGLALETAKKDGIRVESIVVGEDVALQAYGLENKSGRRGMCGMVLVLKVAGYLSKEGKTLESIKTVAESVASSMASIGLCLEACSLPGSGLLFQLKPDEVEVGVGVHGEAGVKKRKLMSAREAVEFLLESLMNHLQVKEGDEVVALVNNLGSLTQMEQWIVAGELERQIKRKRVRLERIFVGPLFTSLNMAGIQICLLKPESALRELVLKALDDPTFAPAWPASAPALGASSLRQLQPIIRCAATPPGDVLSLTETTLIERCLREASTDVIKNEDRMNYLDRECGDGDCGTTVARLGREILKAIEDKRLSLSNPARLLYQLSEIADVNMGGTSGAIYSLFFTGAAGEFSRHSSFQGEAHVWGKAWAEGIAFIKKYSVARIGDRTLLDALEPACEAFRKHLERHGAQSVRMSFAVAASTASEGCIKTRLMKAAVGRASYVENSRVKDVDAGAFGVTVWLSAFNRILNQELAYSVKNSSERRLTTNTSSETEE